ncbi:MAG: ABC transporter ATP-binding protein [Candidatus Bathyarchaeia archaeon]
MTVLAELKDVTKIYGEKTALNNVNLQIQEGEIVALLGPNGSGKTTLLKLLAFLEPPTSGTIKFQGEYATAENNEKMRTQSTLVFQRAVLFDTTVYNNVAYGLKIRKIPPDTLETEVRKALRLVQLEGFERCPAKKLSGGEQHRVAIARALALKTKLLLLDEPTANIDPKNASIIEEVITSVNREHKTTIIMATHNMFQAKTIPHRVALMNKGQITEIGATPEIFGDLSKNLARFAAVDNTFVGTAKTTQAGATIVNVGNNVEIEVTSRMQGEVSIFVNPKDIILSKHAIQSSARNVFKGRINEIKDLGSLVKLKVDVGKLFAVQVTKRSFSEMELNLGSEVYIAFKASSVEVF